MNFESEHIRRIIQAESAIELLFFDFIRQAAPHLKKLKYRKRGGIWSQNPVIEKQVDRLLREFAARYKAILQQFVYDAWELSEQKNDELLKKFLKGAGLVYGADFLLKAFNRENPDGVKVTLDNVVTLSRNLAARNAFFSNRLAEVISDRVWKLTRQNKTLILKITASGILEGKSAASISRDLRKYLKNPDALHRRVRDPETGKLKLSKPMKAYHPGQGVYRSAFKNAVRLARNETNMAYRKADMIRWQQTDFILGYEVRLSASHPEYDQCDELKGKYPKSFIFTSWHVMCLCYAVPILPKQEDFVKYVQDDTPLTGYVKGIPPRAGSYTRKNTAQILSMPATKRPYWVRDNFRIDGDKFKLNIK